MAEHQLVTDGRSAMAHTNRHTDNAALTEIWPTMLADCMQETVDAVEGELSLEQRK